MITILSYLMIIVFMIVIFNKKMSPLTALIMVPLVFTIIGFIIGAIDGPIFSTLSTFIKDGIASTANTGIMILFAILFFASMLDAGLFDPIVEKLVYAAKGDPLKITMAAAIVAATVSLNGDGTTTTLIVCSAFIPIFKKMNLRMMNLAVIVILMNSIFNLLPWSGPTARVMPVMNVGSEILPPMIPGMILSTIYVLFIAYRMGKKERTRLGVYDLSGDELTDLATPDATPEAEAIKRPKNFIFNGILTIIVVLWLVVGSFVPAIEVEPVLIFMIGTCLSLIVNWKSLSEQSDRVSANAGDAIQTVILIFAAGVFMGLFQGSGMSDALAQSIIDILPNSFGHIWGVVVALVSIPGTFFISNDGFYFGILPSLAEVGLAYGFTPLEIGLASLMGQAFHLLSPLVAFIYLLIRLTGVDMGEWQKESAKYAIGIFLIFVITIVMTGDLRLFVP